MLRRSLLLATALAACPATVSAQTVPSKEPDIEHASVPPGPAGRSENFTRDIDFDYEISEDSSSASVTIGGYTSKTDSDASGTVQRNTNWSAKLAVPVGGASDLTARATLDALSNGPQFTFTWSWFQFRAAGSGMRGSSQFQEALADAAKACTSTTWDVAREAARAAADAASNQAQTNNLPNIRARVLAAAKKVVERTSPGARPTTEAKILKLVEEIFDEQVKSGPLADGLERFEATVEDQTLARLHAAQIPYPGPVPQMVGLVAYDCNDLDRPMRFQDSAFAKEYSGWTEAQVNMSYRSAMTRLGFDGSIGYNRFAFIDATSLAKREPGKAQFKGGVFGALYPADGVSAVLVRAEYQNAFEAAEDALVCKPVVTDPDKDCVTGAPTPPTNIERVNLSLEYRRVFDNGWNRGKFAISPKATFDTLSNDFVAELPVYFIPRKQAQFSPGLKASYSSKTDKVAFAVFMRTSF